MLDHRKEPIHRGWQGGSYSFAHTIHLGVDTAFNSASLNFSSNT